MNFISLTFVLLLSGGSAFVLEDSMEIQRTLSTGCELFLLHKRKLPGSGGLLLLTTAITYLAELLLRRADTEEPG